MFFHGHGCDEFAPFSKGLTRGLVQAVEPLGYMGQVLGVAWWLVMPCLLNIGVLDGQACHICSTAWEDFRKLCLAKRYQFSHV